MSLEVRHLEGGYGQLRIVNGIDLEVQSGEIVAVLGANGAGKTTLLRLLSGILRPTAGDVRLDSNEITRWRAEQVTAAGLSHVPEGRLVFPGLSVLDNLRLGAWVMRRRKTVDQDIARMFDLFPRLGDRGEQFAGTLSGGEQQMLAIARGLMARPRILLLDEPSLGLAPRVIDEIFKALSAIRATSELGILLVEQNARAAFTIAERGYVLERGRVVTSGTVAQLRADPAVRDAYLGIQPQPSAIQTPTAEGA